MALAVAERTASPAARPSRVVPTAATVYTFQFSASALAKALLDRAQDLLGPQIDVGDVFERALTLLVD